MALIRLKIPAFFRRFLYTILLCSWCTGVAFFILNNWVTVEGEFGPEKHPLQYPLLKLHGAGALIMMICFGALLAGHVPLAWRTGRLRQLGIGLVTVVGLQILSAYLLYYLSSETLRLWVGYAHAALGLVLPLLLLTHVAAARGWRWGVAPASPSTREKVRGTRPTRYT